MKKDKPSKKKVNSIKSKTTIEEQYKEWMQTLFQKEIKKIEKSNNFLNSFIKSRLYDVSLVEEPETDISIPDEISKPFKH